MNYNYKINNNPNNYDESLRDMGNNNMEESIPKSKNKYNDEMNPNKMPNQVQQNQKRIIYNDEEEEADSNMKKIMYNDNYEMKNKNKNYRSEQRVYRGNTNGNIRNENTEEVENNYDDNRMMDGNDLKYRVKTNYRDGNNKINNNMIRDYYSLRNNKKNINDRSYQENYNNNKLYKNMETGDDNYE